MELLELYRSLDSQLPEGRVGRLERRLHPGAAVDLFVCVSTSEPRWSLELRLARDELVGREIPAGTKGIALTALPERSRRPSVLAVQSGDPGALDLFAAVAADLAKLAAPCSRGEEAVDAWFGRFARWQRLLQRAPDGLSASRQRGLFAELWALRDCLIPTVGSDEAVASWQGPTGAPRDFETNGIGMEVKATAINEPQVAVINGERQLDDAGFTALYLVHQSLEVLHGAGETLTSMVSSVRDHLDGAAAADAFEDLLLESGYSDAHAQKYRGVGYVFREIRAFAVREGFPRLVESSLPEGLGGVRYTLAIDACREFAVPLDQVLSDLRGARRGA